MDKSTQSLTSPLGGLLISNVLVRGFSRNYPMAIVLCPGIHDPQLTQSFWKVIQDNASNNLKEAKVHIVKDAQPWAFSAIHVFQSLKQTVSVSEPLTLICFSAGVVGGIGAAWAWQQQGGSVRTFLALDGWGVPLAGSFPIYRFSHDAFTHWTSQPLGMGQNPFYADPSVGHMELWRSPDQAWGWWDRDGQTLRMTAAQVIGQILEQG
jgi:hypothetical protein